MLSSPRFRCAILGCLTFALVFLTAVTEVATAAPGTNVMLVPRRVVFTGRMRSTEVHLINAGLAPVTYRIDLAERRMLPDGHLEEVADLGPDGRSARPLLRYSPRQVTIQPQSSQTVRLLLRKPADLPPGEYRSHLVCRALPPLPPRTAKPADEEATAERRMKFQLTALPSITIPVIVRHGDRLTASVRLTGLELRPGKDAKSSPRLSFQVNREGPISVFGDLSLSFVPKGGGGIRPLAVSRGTAIYRELSSLPEEMSLNLPPGEALGPGRLRLTFLSRPDDDGGGAPVAATAEIELP